MSQTEETKLVQDLRQSEPANVRRCPDYDEDCKYVKNPYICFMGGEFVCKNGVEVSLDRAEGYCPLIHKNN